MPVAARNRRERKPPRDCDGGVGAALCPVAQLALSSLAPAPHSAQSSEATGKRVTGRDANKHGAASHRRGDARFCVGGATAELAVAADSMAVGGSVGGDAACKIIPGGQFREQEPANDRRCNRLGGDPGCAVAQGTVGV